MISEPSPDLRPSARAGITSMKRLCGSFLNNAEMGHRVKFTIFKTVDRIITTKVKRIETSKTAYRIGRLVHQFHE